MKGLSVGLALLGCGARSGLGLLEPPREQAASGGGANVGGTSGSAQGAANGTAGSASGASGVGHGGTAAGRGGDAGVAGVGGIGGIGGSSAGGSAGSQAGSGGASDACALVSCLNGGACVLTPTGPRCQCQGGFVGASCELPGFAGLGILGDAKQSRAHGISADGRVAVGALEYSSSYTSQGFRWSPASGIVGLGFLSLSTESVAYDVSADGSYIAGSGSVTLERPIRWDANQTPLNLGIAPFRNNAYATGISADGSTVIGYAYSNSDIVDHVFRWTAADGMNELGPGRADGISRDGRVIAGSISPSDGSFGLAVHWDAPSWAPVMLPNPTAFTYTAAHATNADGSVFVGEAFDWTVSAHAVRWTRDGASDLGTFGVDAFCAAYAVDADGGVAAGQCSPTSLFEDTGSAVIWDAQGGLRSLQDALATLGNDLTGWQLIRASGVSADGRVFAGWGRDPSGKIEAWIARLGP